MEFLIFAGAVWLLLIAAKFALYLRVLTTSGLRSADGVICAIDEVPPDLRELLANGIVQLKRLGFEFSHLERRKDVFAAVNTPHWVAVLKHAGEKAYAEVSAHAMPDAFLQTRVDFISLFPQDTVITMQGLAHGVFPGFARLRCFDVYGEDLKSRWQGHLDKVAELGPELRDSATALTLSHEAYCQRLKTDEAEYWQYQLASGVVKQHDDHFRVKFAAAIKMLSRMIRGETEHLKFRKTHIETNSNRPAFTTGVELNAFLRHQEIFAGARWSGLAKTLIFALSVLGFALLFGATWSPRIVLILIPVLLFHELGHILAMRCFGYRDLQMLFLPIGAAALGEKHDAPAWQRIIVYLAGPVPGLLLALSIVMFYPVWNLHDWLHELVLILAILNYINLLPFMPFDGGQIVNVVLFDRFPRLQIAFQLLSTAALLLGAWALLDPILAILGIVMAIGLAAQYRDPKLLKLVNQTVDGNASLDVERDEDARIARRLFDVMKDQSSIFEEKIQTIKRLLPRLRHRPARSWEMASGLAVYIIVLGLPLFVTASQIGLVAAWGGRATAFESSPGYPADERLTSEYWQQKISETTAPRKRFDMAVEANNALKFNVDHAEHLPILDAGIAVAKQHNWTQESSYLDLLSTRIAVLAYADSMPERVDQDFTELEKSLAEEDPRLLEALSTIGAAQRNIAYLERAISIQENAGDQYAVLSLLTTIGSIYEEQAKHHEAERVYQSAAQLFDDQQDNSTGLHLLAEFYVRQSRLNEALKVFQTALSMANAAYGQSYLLDSLGWVALFNSQFEDAEQWFERRDLARREEQAQIKESVGFIGRLLMGDQLDAVAASQVSDFESWLVLAVLQGDKTAAQRQLENMRELLERSGYSDLSEYLRGREEVTEAKMDADVDIHANALYKRKANAAVKAINATLGNQTAMNSNTMTVRKLAALNDSVN